MAILSKVCFTNTRHDPEEAQRGYVSVLELLQGVAEKMNAEFSGPTIVVDGWALIGPDTPYAYVDGVHPNDYGFAMMAQNLAPVLKAMLMTSGDQPG